MKSNRLHHRLLSSTMMGGLTLAAASLMPALAQPAATPPATAAPAGEEEVVVTGSRIRQPNMTSVSPLTTMTSQDVKLQGTTNVEQLLNNLPQFQVGVDSQTVGVSNGASGGASVDLRGLGTARTLVLVDGKRLMPGDPAFPVADLNNIPAAVIDRVDVVTGGASAVYGSDAVAGVVNFILKRDFEGVRLDASYTFSNHSNNNDYYRDLQGQQGVSFYTKAPGGNNSLTLTNDVTLMIGVNSADDKGNVTAYLSYRQQKPILQQDFDVSACSLGASNVNDPDSYIYDGRACFGSNANSAYGAFKLAAGSRNPGSVGGTTFHTSTDGSKTFVTTGVPAFNYGPLNYFQRPDERYIGGLKAHYQVSSQVEVYADFMFTDDHTVAQIAPSGLFSGTGANGGSTYAINCNNPLMTAAQQVQMCGPAAAGTPATVDLTIGYRFAGLPRQDDLRHTQYKIDFGVRGNLNENWSYDAYLQYGTSIFNEHYNNDVSVAKVQNALLVDPVTGQCFVGGTCVPLNIFQFNGPSAAAIAYTVTPGFKSGSTEEEIASVSLVGDLTDYGFKLPWADRGISVAFGAEYRREKLELITDAEFASGDLSGQGGPTLSNSGAFEVHEFFAEAQIPVIEDAPFAKLLSFDLGYRYSDYSTAGEAQAYKIDGQWAPSDDIRFRAGYNRAVRAPNVVELFAPAAVGLFGGSDPCAGATPTASLAVCQTMGVTPAQYGNIDGCPAGQCSALFSGNLALKPEEADTYTIGFVFTPTFDFLRGFTASVDYFSIDVKDYINVNPVATVAACAAGDLSACALFNRDPATGAIFGLAGFINAPVANTGGLTTKGFDVDVGYKADLADWGISGVGMLSFNLIGTYTEELVFTPIVGGPSYDCVGLYGPTCGAPLPKWRHQFRVSLTPDDLPLTVSLLWRHIGPVELESNENNVLLFNHPSGVTDTADQHIGDYDYLDISGTYTVNDRYTIRFGVNNVMDRDPPGVDSNVVPVSSPPTGNGNTFPGVYDVYGRTVFIGITADF